MKRVITSLSLLLLMLCGVYAQDISQYEYWTDDDYASRNVVSSSGGDISLDVSTQSLSAGIHFLNFRAGRSDGVWGHFYRYLYYIPVLKHDEEGNLNVEYWLDDNLAGKKSDAPSDGNLSLAVDVSSLSSGVHYFNCTPISSTRGRGNTERHLFYVPIPPRNATIVNVKGYEYWLDDNYSALVKKNSEAGEQLLTLSLEGLASGVHYFNCRAVNERGEYGCPVREMFYIPQTEVNANAQIAKSEYWLDDDYANRTTLTTPSTEHAFNIDISELASGVHYFNYRSVDNKGVWGNAIRQVFYITRSNTPTSYGTISYEYWVDDDTGYKVTGSGSAAECVFSVDVSSLEEGTHTFNFRAKDALDQWGETFVYEFLLDFSIPFILGDVNADGVLNAADIVELINFLNDWPVTDNFSESRADVTNNGRINEKDLEELVKLIMGQQ